MRPLARSTSRWRCRRVVFAWFGRPMQVGGVLFSCLTLLVAINPQAPELAWLTWLALSVAIFVAGIAMPWASRAMRDRSCGHRDARTAST